MSLINNNASTSVSPDLDWSQLRETVRLLSLPVAQIEMVMNDGDESVAAFEQSLDVWRNYTDDGKESEDIELF